MVVDVVCHDRGEQTARRAVPSRGGRMECRTGRVPGERPERCAWGSRLLPLEVEATLVVTTVGVGHDVATEDVIDGVEEPTVLVTAARAANSLGPGTAAVVNAIAVGATAVVVAVAATVIVTVVVTTVSVVADVTVVMPAIRVVLDVIVFEVTVVGRVAVAEPTVAGAAHGVKMVEAGVVERSAVVMTASKWSWLRLLYESTRS